MSKMRNPPSGPFRSVFSGVATLNTTAAQALSGSPTPQRFTSTDLQLSGVSTRVLFMISAELVPDDAAPIDLYVYTRPLIAGGAWAFQLVSTTGKLGTFFAEVPGLAEAEYEVAIGAQSAEGFTLGKVSLAVLSA